MRDQMSELTVHRLPPPTHPHLTLVRARASSSLEKIIVTNYAGQDQTKKQKKLASHINVSRVKGHVKMAYRCSKFNAYRLLIWRKNKYRLKKIIRLHIFQDDGVAAAEWYIFFLE